MKEKSFLRISIWDNRLNWQRLPLKVRELEVKKSYKLNTTNQHWDLLTLKIWTIRRRFFRLTITKLNTGKIVLNSLMASTQTKLPQAKCRPKLKLKYLLSKVKATRIRSRLKDQFKTIVRSQTLSILGHLPRSSSKCRTTTFIKCTSLRTHPLAISISMRIPTTTTLTWTSSRIGL